MQTLQQRKVTYLQIQQIQINDIPHSTCSNLNDFIKRFRHCYIQEYQINAMLMIYENSFKTRLLVERESDFINLVSNYDMNNRGVDMLEQRYQSEEQLPQQNISKKKQQSTVHADINFQTVPYDSAFINNQSTYPSRNNNNHTYQFSKLIITSNRQMPVRIYEAGFNNTNDNKNNKQILSTSISLYCTFNDHKQNSQVFLSPYQFAAKNSTIIGGGRKFLNIYDVEKIKTSRVKSFDKTHISTVQLLDDQKTALIGDFIGNIFTVDFRQQNLNHKQNGFKPHVDAVFHIKSSQTNQNLIVTSARKDNFMYVFDRRNLMTYVKFIEIQRQSNQRYGMCLNGNDLAVGTQDGQIWVDNIVENNSSSSDLDSQKIRIKNQQNMNITDLFMKSSKQNQIQILYAQGTRFYKQFQQKDQKQIGMIEQKTVNKSYGLRKLKLCKKLINKNE